MKCRNIIIILIILMICPVLFAAQLKNSFVDGTLGVGTSTPATKLHVIGTVTATGATIAGISAPYIAQTSGSGNGITLAGNTNMPSGIWNSSGSVGIGIASPASRLTIFEGAADGAGTSSLGIGFQYDSTFTRAGIYADGATGWLGILHFATNPGANSHVITPRMTIRDDKVGIGTTTPSAQLHTTGGVRFATLGSGAVQSDANGNLSVSSDERLKNIQGMFTSSLEAILGIEPILYKYNELSGLDQDGVYAGFSAQNVMQYIPEAVGIDSRGYYSFNDRPVIAALVNAVKELKKEIEELRSHVRIISEDTYENINIEKKL